MNIMDARSLAKWMLDWRHNAHNDREFTIADIAKAVDHWRKGEDAWESAAAICEGRELR